jgi:hypothetical protein
MDSALKTEPRSGMISITRAPRGGIATDLGRQTILLTAQPEGADLGG